MYVPSLMSKCQKDGDGPYVIELDLLLFILYCYIIVHFGPTTQTLVNSKVLRGIFDISLSCPVTVSQSHYVDPTNHEGKKKTDLILLPKSENYLLALEVTLNQQFSPCIITIANY